MAITIRPAQSRRDRRLFHTFPWTIYRDDPLWVPPLLGQRRDRFDPAKNPFIANSVAEPFIAWQDGQPAGTIVMAIDRTRNERWQEDNAVFGYFECTEGYHVAEALFDHAIQWTRTQGKSRLWGPWNLDYEDCHGFLVKGWERPPVIMNGHTPPYYHVYAERYGFQKARRDSLAFCYDIPDENPFPEKLERVVRKLIERTPIVIRQADFSRWDEELALAVDVLNRGLAVLGDTRGFWDLDRMAAHARALRPVLDPAFVLLAEIEGQAVGWVMGLPDLNEAIKTASGLRHPWLWPAFWLALRRRPKAVCMKSAAVDPAYWNRGVDALLFYQFGLNALERGYEWVDFSLTGEDNPMTPRLAGNLGMSEYKRYRIYALSGW
jgi:hypothetical protein